MFRHVLEAKAKNDSTLVDSEEASKDMTAVNAGVHELAGVRLPQAAGGGGGGDGGPAVFMYSTAAADGGVTLQLKEPEDLDRHSLAAVLARLQQDDAQLAVYAAGPDAAADILSDSGIDALLGASSVESGAAGDTSAFDLFDSSSGGCGGGGSAGELTLSPRAFAPDHSDASLPGPPPADSDGVSTTTKDDLKPGSTTPELVKVKRQKPKQPASPNRQGPQQCQVCAKVFGNASALAKHKLTHSDERKYVCNVCGKAFKRQDHLNGHMLTHRNKKPYECRADGCGKSYCDARSLRRHTENHHGPAGAAGAASDDGSPTRAAPGAAGCIQYAPPPGEAAAAAKPDAPPAASAGKSQLQRLLSAEPQKMGGGNNDGLTKQQLDLIHQIMEQTQRQSQQAAKTSAAVPKATAKGSKPSREKGRSSAAPSSTTTWSSGTQASSQQAPKTTATGAASPHARVSTTTPAAAGDKPTPKPVECNLCHRKFKNIPALNGHMRLHGGYFKKDSDGKKSEKKDPSCPPLQTASVSVRALIEEKIINRRNTSATQEDKAPQLSSRFSASPDLEAKASSFAVPAPPQLVDVKSRRHSDAEGMRSTTTQQEAQALADLILKREKTSAKRAADQLLQFPADSFSLDGVPFKDEDAQFMAPSLQDEVFSQDSMLLQGVDPQQLAQIQFQPEALLQDQGDQQFQEISLDDITDLQEHQVVDRPPFHSNRSVNQELQAVLNSPLPESLAEFGTFHSTNNLDIQSPGYQTHSPANYAKSPHASITAQSPLQSPLIRHDSPGFAYPTPPASHEGQSPCFGQNLGLPLVSPTQEFGQVAERGPDEPPQASSPLSAAFFTSTMSSSAAVEEAIQEVLPGESMSEDSLYPLTDTPPAHSDNDPLGLTPVPSPVVTTSIPSPHPSTTYSPLPNAQWCTGLMLPNSEDPLLSSSPKDAPQKKKFEFNGVPVRLISNNGMIELNSASFAGILVDANGEIKLIQTGANSFQGKNFVLANAQMVTTTQNNADEKHKVQRTQKTVQCATSTKHLSSRPKYLKDDTNDVFLSPTTLPASGPAKPSRKRIRTEPLQLPILHQSKLRATRSKPQGAAQYTPQPILNPQRAGTGLFCNLRSKSEDGSSWNCDPTPETDSTPHINIGAQFQCKIPQVHTPPPCRISPEPKYEDLLWDPGISDWSNLEVDMYLDFACCAAVPGGGRNKEYAMHLLHLCGGNIHEAMLRLMQPTPNLPNDHPLLAYSYCESDKWSSSETEIFHKSLVKFDKDFNRISQEIRTKSVKQCVQFYYVWKKVCTEEYNRLKTIRQIKRSHYKNLQADADEKPYPDARLLGIADSESPMRNFVCEYPDCSASFNSRAALNGHIRIHGGTARNSPTPSSTSDRRSSSVSSSTTPSSSGGAAASAVSCHPADSTDQEYPCKICGKVFTKIKSRSAHMKSHRPPDAEPGKRRQSDKDAASSSGLYEPPHPPFL